MLRIIIIILLCSILVYSDSNSLKAVAILALLLQAYYDTRPKKVKENFINILEMNNVFGEEKLKENIINGGQMNNVFGEEKLKKLGIEIGEILYEYKNTLTKKEFLEKIKSSDFKSKVTYKIIKLL